MLGSAALIGAGESDDAKMEVGAALSVLAAAFPSPKDSKAQKSENVKWTDARDFDDVTTLLALLAAT